MGRIDEARTKPWASSRLPDDAIRQQLTAADRASRVLPLGYAASWSLDDTEAEHLDRFHRYSLMLWHGRRLLEDFAVGHAQAVLDRARVVASDAGQATTTVALREAMDAAEARRAAGLTLRSQPAEQLTVDDWGERPIKLLLQAVGDVPAGEASALIGVDPAAPIAITTGASSGDARAGILVPAAQGLVPQEAGFRAVRVESSSEGESFRLTPAAFYRGRFFPAERDLMVTVNATAEPVAVTILQSYRKIDKKIPDQFSLHPGKGYLHPGTDLAYRLLVTNKTGEAMRVRVTYALEGQTEPPRQVVLDLTPRKSTDELTGVVDSQDVPGDRPRSLTVAVTREGETKPLSRRVFRFYQVVPKDYIAVVPNYSPADDRFTLDVKRLRTDPVTGPIPVMVVVAGQTYKHVFQRGESKIFSFVVPNSAAAIPWSVTVEEVLDAFRGEEPARASQRSPAGESTTSP
jgi:hypothetical protein